MDQEGYTICGDRKARIAPNIVEEGKPLGVFKHTWYLGKWHYDGYIPCVDQTEAADLMDKWLKGELPRSYPNK